MSTEIIHIQSQRSADVLSGSSASQEVSRYFDGENSPKLPDSGSMEYGEIALNIAKGYEVIATKNYDGEIVYLPFNVARKLDETNTRLEDFSGYTLSKIEELEGSTSGISETIWWLKEEIGGITVNIAELSGSMLSVSAYTKSSIDSLSAATADAIESLSASTKDGLDKVNDRISNLKLGDLSDVDITIEPSTSGDVVDFLTRSGDTWVNTPVLITDISGVTEAINEINENLDELDLVHAGAFKHFRMATGVDQNVDYKPQWEPIQGMNMTEAIDFIGEVLEENNEGYEKVKSDGIDNELTTAGAVARINASLGFTRNATYESEIDDLYGMTVKEAVDYMYGSVKDIKDYIDLDNTRNIITAITYENLVRLQESGKLRWGGVYRITNYQATVSDSRLRTRTSVVESGANTNNGFEIIVRAINNTTLSDNVMFMASSYNKYFEDNNVEAWVGKYSLKNDTQRFSWAKEGGFGVIYYLRDEYNNEAWYDFKNIKILGDDGRAYFTFEDSSNGLDMSSTGDANGNSIGQAMYGTFSNKAMLQVNGVRFVGRHVKGNKIGQGCVDAVFTGDFDSNLISSMYSGRRLDGDLKDNILGYDTPENAYFRNLLEDSAIVYA